MCCHRCVPGCLSCPCSAPPASANGAKVSGAMVAVSATSPWGLCACPGLQECQSSRGERLLCAFPAVFHLHSFWGPPLLPNAVLQPVSTNQAKPPSLHGLSLSHTLPLCFPIPALSWQTTAVCCPGQRAAPSASGWTRTAPSAPTR